MAEDELAIFGGKPVRDTFLPYGHQAIDEEDISAVVDVLRSDWLTTGPKVAEFEKSLANFVGSRYAVSFSSGTAALHGAVFAAGLRAGDEAITTPMTFCATSNCLLYQGARPVFADVASDTLNIDPCEAARCVTPRTKAIIPVDYAGHPADLDAIKEMAEDEGIIVIEDACHALGAEYMGKRVGSISHMTVFSFHPVKHITTGEGGMVTTNDPELAARLLLFRNHGISSDARQREQQKQWYYEMIALGYNYRLTDIGSALGLSQLKKLDRNIARRQEIAKRYRDAFEGLLGVILPVERHGVSSAWHLYAIRIDPKKTSATRAQVFSALRGENIGVNVHYIPVHLHPYYRELFGYRGGEYPVAESAYEMLLSLPMFHGMADSDVEDVIRAVRKTMDHYRK